MRHKVARCSLVIGVMTFVGHFTTPSAEGLLLTIAIVAFACTFLFGKGNWQAGGFFLGIFALLAAVSVIRKSHGTVRSSWHAEREHREQPSLVHP